MDSNYRLSKPGKLKLKGEKPKKHKSKKAKKRKRDDSPTAGRVSLKEKELTDYGGWWSVDLTSEITGSVAIELDSQCFVSSLDNGKFTIGAKRPEGAGPAAEEVFTAVNVGETRVAFKSGFDKYVGFNDKGVMVGVSDAIGAREQWEPVFQEGQLALLGANGCFMSVNESDDVVCQSKTAGSAEMLKIRSNIDRSFDPNAAIPVEERGKINDTEVNYVKKFQSYQDRKLRVSKEEKTALKRAKVDGNLHGVMLDRREKMKADRYCK